MQHRNSNININAQTHRDGRPIRGRAAVDTVLRAEAPTSPIDKQKVSSQAVANVRVIQAR